MIERPPVPSTRADQRRGSRGVFPATSVGLVKPLATDFVHTFTSGTVNPDPEARTS